MALRAFVISVALTSAFAGHHNLLSIKHDSLRIPDVASGKILKGSEVFGNEVGVARAPPRRLPRGRAGPRPAYTKGLALFGGAVGALLIIAICVIVCFFPASRDDVKETPIPWRVQMLDEDVDPVGNNPVDMAARSLCENGFVVLDGGAGVPLVPAELVDRCKEDALCNLKERLEEFEKRTGKDPRCFKFLLKEICHRSYLRFDLLLDKDCWAQLYDSALAEAMPVLKAAGLAGQRILTGCVISMPGSHNQHVHQDGPNSDFVNVFVPLVDVDELNGPTEFIPGSHQHGTLPPISTVSRPRGPAPKIKKGNLILFRYTCQHWGHKNHGQDPRPVAYFTVAPEVPEDKGDGTNFGSRSLEEVGECKSCEFKRFDHLSTGLQMHSP